MRRTYAVFVVAAVLVCGCVGSGQGSDSSFIRWSPEPGHLATEPYQPLSFEAEGADGTGVAWYVDGSHEGDGTQFSYMPKSEGTHTVTASIGTRDGMSSLLWEVTVAIDLAALMEEVSALRALPFVDRVRVEDITRDELRARLGDELAASRDQLAVTQAIFEALYVWDGTDLYEEMLSLYAGSIEGMYDYDTGIFFTVSDSGKPPAATRLTMAHELVHVLQDQTYGILALMDGCLDDDADLAIQSLLEGDASHLEAAYVTGRPLPELQALYAYYLTLDMPDIHPFMASLAYFPYVYGEAFVAAVADGRSSDALAEVYASPPSCTKHILHPEAYLAGVVPEEVGSSGINGFFGMDESVLGEGMLLTILSQHLPYQMAETAADGWNGDRYGYYVKDDTYVFTWNVAWERDHDAFEFAEAWSAYLEAATGVEPWWEGAALIHEGDEQTACLGIEGRTTTLYISNDHSMALQRQASE